MYYLGKCIYTKPSTVVALGENYGFDGKGGCEIPTFDFCINFFFWNKHVFTL